MGGFGSWLEGSVGAGFGQEDYAFARQFYRLPNA